MNEYGYYNIDLDRIFAIFQRVTKMSTSVGIFNRTIQHQMKYQAQSFSYEYSLNHGM